MNLTIRLLGVEVFAISTDGPDAGTGNGDCTTNPVGFAGWTQDARWQPGGEP